MDVRSKPESKCFIVKSRRLFSRRNGMKGQEQMCVERARDTDSDGKLTAYSA